MYYVKVIVDGNFIEFHNNAWGKETVKMNGQVVSQKKSIMGIQHHFTVQNGRSEDQYVVVSKVINMAVCIDVIKNGNIVIQNMIVGMGESTVNQFKKEGMSFFKQYKLNEALQSFQKAEALDGHDAEIPLYMACIYSIREDISNGFRCLKRSIEKKLGDLSVIDTMDQLAYLRMHPAFPEFKESGFSESHLI